MENMCIVLGGYFNQSKIFWNAKGAHNVLGSLGIILKKGDFHEYLIVQFVGQSQSENVIVA